MCEKTSMGMGKPLPPPLPDVEEYTVEYEGEDDPDHPFNWSRSTKLFTSFLVCAGTFIVSFSSAVFAPAIPSASRDLDTSTEVATLGTTLFVLGFAAGPLLWAPGSELHGRRWPLAAALVLGGILSIAAASATNMQTLLVCRFFAGACGASQLTVVPGVLADLYDNAHRGVAVQLYALTVFGGPFLAAPVGGFIVAAAGGSGQAALWRWTLYVPGILSLVDGVASVFFLRETYAPVLLAGKAVALRRRTGIWGIHARHERVEVDAAVLAETYLAQPLRMLASEPIVLLVSLYMSFIYGLVYCLLEAYPVVFESTYGMEPGISGLPFLAVLLGVVLGVCYILSHLGSYRRKLAENKNVPVPEWRLRPTLLGGPVFAVGIFWFGWTGFTAKIHWAVPTIAGVFIGFGVLCVFLPCFNYLIDAYLPLAASTVAANIILRSTVAAAFPLFSKQMFEGMGVQWAGTLLGCLAAAMIPIPYLFRVYGARVRGKSRLLQSM
ncbi:MFS general substrate transporter [Cryphonectria parasitica EP155]|uniref:MFS general substrate transporter n=1 Tax=Cryphonectria parasitica (strain ATCC 38755 / EP155) TaxID=660469 RepID=A0A9P4XW31_CRYP1|nr:MFS general substrate transporter [Cryphonectria parasitica EP155]KAF3761845.1 MFS general substrate transporter [Cryphonectria parasitica EP155]